MEKICIVKRRRPVQENVLLSRTGTDACDHSQSLSIELTPQQAEIVRSNTHFQHLYTGKNAPIFLNLHFNDGPLQKMLTTREICQMLQVSRHTLDRIVRSGCIKSYRVGRQRRFSPEDIMDYLANGIGLGGLRSVQVDIVGRSEREFEASSK
jgi:excisionase family DNA binding protein